MSANASGAGLAQPDPATQNVSSAPTQPRPRQDNGRGAAEFVTGLQRRRGSAWRCPPLPDGHRDPYWDRRPARWSRVELDGWREAVEHLRAHGHDVGWAVPAEVAEQLAVAE